MVKVALIAGVDCWYNGALLARGQRFLAAPHDAKILKLIKRASDAPPDDPSESPLPEATVEPLTSDPGQTDAPPKRKRGRPRKIDPDARVYRRRDMEPEL